MRYAAAGPSAHDFIPNVALEVKASIFGDGGADVADHDPVSGVHRNLLLPEEDDAREISGRVDHTEFFQVEML